MNGASNFLWLDFFLYKLIFFLPQKAWHSSRMVHVGITTQLNFGLSFLPFFFFFLLSFLFLNREFSLGQQVSEVSGDGLPTPSPGMTRLPGLENYWRRF